MEESEKIELINAADKAQRNSYSPYSNFRVGAAVKMETGEIYFGANVENASYGLTICAERAAVFSAISHGRQKIRALAITSSKEKPTPPCGACRQVIREFSTPSTIIIMAGKNKEIDVRSIDELLPFSFTL